MSRITVAMSSGPQRAGDVRAARARLGDSSSRHRTCRPGGLGYLLEDGLGHEHVHLAAEAPGGGVLHQHVGAALAVRRVQEVVPGLTVVLLCEGREAVSAAAPGRRSGFCVSPRSSDPPRPFVLQCLLEISRGPQRVALGLHACLEGPPGEHSPPTVRPCLSAHGPWHGLAAP